MSRIATCSGCRAKESGLKSRIAIPHTCGLEPHSARTKRDWLIDPPVQNDVDPVSDDVKRFYEVCDEEIEETQYPATPHKWDTKWESEYISPTLRMMGVTSWKRRKCLVCGACQDKTWYKGKIWPEIDVHRNGRTDVDCNPELAPKK